MKPLIGITTGEMLHAKFAWTPHVYGQGLKYVEAIEAAGGMAVMIPFIADHDEAQQLVARLDGVLFAGGNDITPEVYGEQLTHAIETSRLRDESELLLMDAAQKQNKPVLAICRGLQLLNVSRGGTLYQDILLDLHSAENHSESEEFEDIARLSHAIHIDKNTKLAGILGTQEVMTNTFHHQAVKKLGNGLIVSARATDGVVEGIEDPKQGFTIAVQSHPESLFNSTELLWAKLFAEFVDYSRSNI